MDSRLRGNDVANHGNAPWLTCGMDSRLCGNDVANHGNAPWLTCDMDSRLRGNDVANHGNAPWLTYGMDSRLCGNDVGTSRRTTPPNGRTTPLSFPWRRESMPFANILPPSPFRTP